MENKILELFDKQDAVSMVNDILPIVLDEFENQPIDAQQCVMAADFVEQLLFGVYTAGVQVICVPKFSGNPHIGALLVEDFIYKKVGGCSCEWSVTV